MSRSKKIINVIVMSLICLLMVLPFMWIFSTSLRLPKESFKMPPSFLPTSFNIENYSEVFKKFPFFRFILNSLFVCITAGVINIFVTTTSAFAFSRLKFKGQSQIFGVFMIGLMVPMQAVIIPQFLLIAKGGLVGSLWALILPATITPLSIFLVRQHMLTIPKSYDESAFMDGANKFVIYSRIILPMSKSVILMTTLVNFLVNWNNFLGPLIYLSDWEKMTLPMGLKMLQGYQGTGSIAVIFAGVFVSIIPPFLIYLFGQKYLVKGVALSGLKS